MVAAATDLSVVLVHLDGQGLDLRMEDDVKGPLFHHREGTQGREHHLDATMTQERGVEKTVILTHISHPSIVEGCGVTGPFLLKALAHLSTGARLVEDGMILDQ